MTKITVDFIMPEAASGPTTSSDQNHSPDAVKARPSHGVARIGKCSCGSDNFVLANEMRADPGKGIPSSRMYECTSCGEYRLG